MIRQLTLLAVLLASCSSSPASNCSVFCNLCQQGLGLFQKNIDLIESVTHNQLTGLIDNLCSLAPKIEIVKLVCDVARDDVVDGINKILEFLRKTANPEVTCHQIHLC